MLPLHWWRTITLLQTHALILSHSYALCHIPLLLTKSCVDVGKITMSLGSKIKAVQQILWSKWALLKGTFLNNILVAGRPQYWFIWGWGSNRSGCLPEEIKDHEKEVVCFVRTQHLTTCQVSHGWLKFKVRILYPKVQAVQKPAENPTRRFSDLINILRCNNLLL